MDIQRIVDKVLPIFESHKNEEDVEVEIRLGRHNGSLFDTNVGKDAWNKILRALQRFDGWEQKTDKVVDVYYNDSEGIRITSDENTGEQECIQKVTIQKEDFFDSRQPLDVRFCIAREIPTSGEYEMDRKRSKTRHSFIRKNLSIDMTISSGDPIDKDSEEGQFLLPARVEPTITGAGAAYALLPERYQACVRNGRCLSRPPSD